MSNNRNFHASKEEPTLYKVCARPTCVYNFDIKIMIKLKILIPIYSDIYTFIVKADKDG